jgi:hypothetical protein
MNSGRRKEIAKLRYELNLRIIDFEELVAENERFAIEVRKNGFESDDTKYLLASNNRNIRRARLDVEDAEKRLEYMENKYMSDRQKR